MAALIRRHVLYDIIALAVCLAGILGLIAFFALMKTRGYTAPRPLFLFLLTMVAAPYLIALRRQPKLLYLVPAIVVVFLMYPIAAPHGMVFYRDPIFNYQFSLGVIDHQSWIPGLGTAYSRAYSYYPVGNIFISVVTLIMKAPPQEAYIWIEPLARLAVIPGAVYSIGRRIFTSRVATLGLFFYLGSASILFNVPLQMGNGTLFFALAVLSIVIARRNTGMNKWRIYALYSIFAATIVMTHHLSSYLFAVWMMVTVVLTYLPSLKGFSSRLEVFLSFEVYILAFASYVIVTTSGLVLKQTEDLEAFISNFIEPQGIKSTPVSLGRSFALYETIWLAGAVLGILFLAYLATMRLRRSKQNKLAVALTLSAAFLIMTTLPLMATSLSYIPLRMSEYSNLLLAPMAATTILSYIGNEQDTSKVRFLSKLKFLHRIRLGRKKKTLVAAGLMAVIFMGGSLAPITARQYFEPIEYRITDSPFNIGQDSSRAADYAKIHFGSSRVWSDQMGVTVFGGFATMEIDWGHYVFFEKTQLDARAWSHLKVGDYIVVNKFMTLERPEFLDLTGPTTKLNQSVVMKFNNYPELALAYQDATFSIYRVMSIYSP